MLQGGDLVAINIPYWSEQTWTNNVYFTGSPVRIGIMCHNIKAMPAPSPK